MDMSSELESMGKNMYGHCDAENSISKESFATTIHEKLESMDSYFKQYKKQKKTAREKEYFGALQNRFKKYKEGMEQVLTASSKGDADGATEAINVTVSYTHLDVYKRQDNYRELFKSGDVWIYFKNTMILWIMCFIPQIFFSLLLGAWFSDVRLRLKGSRFFKTVIYLPNLIMASAFSMLFFTLFSDAGPINSLLMQIGFISEPYKFLSHTGSARGLIALMNCLMWFGNTTILLMAGMMGIDTSLFEAAEVDGATSTQVFFKITLPLLRPILIYVCLLYTSRCV